MRNIHFRNISIFIMLGIIALFACSGCGPSQEQIRAMELRREQARVQTEARLKAEEENRRQAVEAKRQAEEAKRQAEQARLAKIRSVEMAGDEAAQAGDADTALSHYKEVLNLSNDNNNEDQRLREKIISFVVSSKRQPSIPEEARRYAIRAQTLVKAKQSAGYAPAVTELTKAMLLAPWWADGYYNLGLMQEGAGDFAGAIRSLKLCLMADTNAANSGAIQNKIYELEVLKEEADKTRAMAGKWKNPKSGKIYDVSLNGKNFQAIGQQGLIIRGVMDGNTIEGTITIPSDKGWENSDCKIPEYTVPLSAQIGLDGKSVTFHYMDNRYTSSYWNIGQGVNRTGHYQGECISVTLQGSSPDEFTITR